MLDAIAQVLVSPINQFLLGLFIGVLLIKYSEKFKRTGKALMILSSSWFVLCSQYTFSHWLISPLENAYPPIQIDDPQWQNTEAIWVLACFHFDAEELPKVSQFNTCSLERLVQAANMYRKKSIPIYLSGGNFVKGSQYSHSTLAAGFLEELGVSKDDIIFVSIGHNTVEEASAISSSIINKRISVVSSATHGTRLSWILNELDVDYIFIPVHYMTQGENVFRINFPSIEALKRSERAMYEYAALVKHYVFH